MYNLEFLPSAKNDMVEIIKYISHTLNNPTAAETLAEKMIDAAEKLTEFPYSYPVYIPIRHLNHEYRKRNLSLLLELCIQKEITKNF